MHRYWDFLVKKTQKYKWKKFHFELSSKPDVDIVGIKVYMWVKHEFETIFTSNDVMNIKYVIGKGLGIEK